MEEKINSAGDQFLSNYLDHPNNLRKLIIRPEPEYLDSVRNQIQDLDAEQRKLLLSKLISGAGTEDKYWTQDKRDGALEILRLIELRDDEKEYSLSEYLSALNGVKHRADPYGSLDALIETGVIIASTLEPEKFVVEGTDKREAIFSKWQQIGRFLVPRDLIYVNERVKQIRESMEPASDELIRSSLNRPLVQPHQENQPQERLGDRDSPELDNKYEELYDSYIESQNEGRNFKLTLWEETPEFRKICEEAGIHLERFWNINEPEEVSGQVKILKQTDSMSLKTKFNRSLTRLTGTTLEDLDEDQSKVLADEIIVAARDTRQEILDSVQDFDKILQNISSVIEAEKSKGRAIGRALIRPVINLFEESGVHLEEGQSVLALLTDENAIGEARRNFTRTQDLKLAEAEVLDKTFDLSNKDFDISLSSRNRADLYLGDETGDCTSWHLNIGFNAWTVPVWLTNPGFNFVKIRDSDNLVIKFGVILGKSESGPVLIIDSHEAGKNITDESQAIWQVEGALGKIKAWSSRIGINSIRMVEYSNSGKLRPTIARYLSPSDTKTEILGGLKGVSEYRKNKCGSETDETIYLQSVTGDIDGDDEYTITNEDLIEFESKISQTMEQAPPEVKQEMENAIRNNNWVELEDIILSQNFPTAYELDGYISEELISLASPHLNPRYVVLNAAFQMLETIEERLNYELSDMPQLLQKVQGSQLVNRLEEITTPSKDHTETRKKILQEMREFESFDMKWFEDDQGEELFERLYGETASDSKGRIMIDYNIPKLEI